MTTHTFKRVIEEVGVAARETPRLYFSGVKVFADALGRLLTRSTIEGYTGVKVGKHASADKAFNAQASALRHNRKNRLHPKK